VPAFAAVARSREALERMAADPRVRRIDLDVGGTGSLTASVPTIGADHRHTRNNRGAGVVVAILDTGIDTDHPDLADALVHEACFGDNNSSIDGTGFCPNGSDRQTGAGAAEDDAGHGTHVAGIVASNGTVSGAGMAPDASIVAIKVLDNCSLAGCFNAFSEIVAALDYIIANPQLNVRVISMSLGTSSLFAGACDDSAAYTMAGAAAVNTLRTRSWIRISSRSPRGRYTGCG
jgi:subtilisin family serine protease